MIRDADHALGPVVDPSTGVATTSHRVSQNQRRIVRIDGTTASPDMRAPEGGVFSIHDIWEFARRKFG